MSCLVEVRLETAKAKRLLKGNVIKTLGRIINNAETNEIPNKEVPICEWVTHRRSWKDNIYLQLRLFNRYEWLTRGRSVCAFACVVLTLSLNMEVSFNLRCYCFLKVCLSFLKVFIFLFLDVMKVIQKMPLSVLSEMWRNSEAIPTRNIDLDEFINIDTILLLIYQQVIGVTKNLQKTKETLLQFNHYETCNFTAKARQTTLLNFVEFLK